MAIEVRYDRDADVWHDPPKGVVATTATLAVYKPSGVVLESPTVAKPTTSSTVQAGSTAGQLILADASGFSVGERVSVVSDGVTSVPRIARIDSNTLHLLNELPDVPDTGATVSKVRLTATISAPGVALLGTDYRAEWVYDDGTSKGYHTEAVHIVRWPFQPPLTGDDVLEYVTSTFREGRRTQLWCQDIADRATERIRRHLLATNRRPHLFPDPAALRESAWTAVRWTLAEEGYGQQGEGVSESIRQLRYQFNDEITAVVQSLTAYDADADGAISADEQRGGFFTAAVSR